MLVLRGKRGPWGPVGVGNVAFATFLVHIAQVHESIKGVEEFCRREMGLTTEV